MTASLLAEIATIALVVGVLVSCTTTLVMVLGVARPDRRPSHDVVPPTGGFARPDSTLAAARSRALRAAELEAAGATPPDRTGDRDRVIEVGRVRDVSPPEPIPLPPAGRIRSTGDVLGGAAPGSVEEVRAVIDHLVEANPQLLAEVITQWIRTDTPDTPHPDGPSSGYGLDLRH